MCGGVIQIVINDSGENLGRAANIQIGFNLLPVTRVQKFSRIVAWVKIAILLLRDDLLGGMTRLATQPRKSVGRKAPARVATAYATLNWKRSRRCTGVLVGWFCGHRCAVQLYGPVRGAC